MMMKSPFCREVRNIDQPQETGKWRLGYMRKTSTSRGDSRASQLIEKQHNIRHL